VYYYLSISVSVLMIFYQNGVELDFDGMELIVSRWDVLTGCPGCSDTIVCARISAR